VDPSTDIAVIKVEADGLTAIPFGNSDQVRVGEWVLAIGNPFNLNSTVTAGIVSAKSRNINILRDRAAIESFIQTDAAINPGNSGGALVNLAGELIGINTAIASPTGSYSGYGFAVPVVLVRKIVEDLVQYGTVQRGYLGATIRSLDGNLAREKGLNLTEGVYVDSLLANSAAEEAGIKSGDVITAVDGKTVKSSSDLLAAVGARRPGDKVAVVLSRKGQTREVTVVLKNRAGNTDIVKKSETGALNKLGAEFETLAPEVARKLGLEGGVRVSSLSAGKLSQSTQIRTGFIITHVDGKRVRNVEELDTALDGKSGGVMLEGFYENNLARKYYYGFGLD
jgi:S1-C subfamily serine protease